VHLHINRSTDIEGIPSRALVGLDLDQETQASRRLGSDAGQKPAERLVWCILGKFNNHVTLCGNFIEPEATRRHQMAGVGHFAA